MSALSDAFDALSTALVSKFTDASPESLVMQGPAELIQTVEHFEQLPDGSHGVVVHDFEISTLWMHRFPTANFTVNVTNLPEEDEKVFSLALSITTPNNHFPSALQVDGVAVAIKWAGGVDPVPSLSRVDNYVFNLYRLSNAWVCLGTFTPYGPGA